MDIVLDDRRRDVSWALALAVLVVAVGVRALFLVGSADRDWPHSILYEGDAPVWTDWAQSLDQGQPFEFDLPVRVPGVAFVLHWLKPGIMGPPCFWLKITWCVISALTCAMLYVVLARSVNYRTAIVATMLLVFSFGQYVMATSLNNESLYALAVVLIVGGTLRFNAHPGLGLVIVLGILHGLASLLRAEHTLLLLLLMAYSALNIVRDNGHDRRHAEEAGPPRGLRLGLLLAMVVISVLVCLPWSLRSAEATKRFNETALVPPDYDAANLRWTDEAKAAIEALPAFAREGNVAYINHLVSIRRVHVTVEDVEAFFQDEWGYTPEPLTTWTLVSSKGPLDFALANHPDATGGFSLAGLRDAEGRDVSLSFGRPSHLKLYNHGFAEGLGYISADPVRWLKLISAKVWIFADGITTGFTARNLPYGDGGVRRAVDCVTPASNSAWWGRAAIWGLLLLGVVVAAHRRIAGIWIIVILYKLIVTVLFYGYARQAVSIHPAFYVLVALGLDAILTRVERPLGAAKRILPALGLLVGVALVAVDTISAFRPREVIAVPAEDGVVETAPHLGTGAFLSNDELVIRVEGE